MFIAIFFEAIQHPKSMLNNIFILYINTKQLYIYNIIFTNISGYIQLVVLWCFKNDFIIMFYRVEKVLNVICIVVDNRIKNNKSGLFLAQSFYKQVKLTFWYLWMVCLQQESDCINEINKFQIDWFEICWFHLFKLSLFSSKHR